MIFVFVRARHHVISLRHNRVGHYTAYRLQRESFEEELRKENRRGGKRRTAKELRSLARKRLGALVDVVEGRLGNGAREVVASYVDEIRLSPTDSRGQLVLNPAACAVLNGDDSDLWVSMVPRAGVEPTLPAPEAGALSN